MNNNMPNNFSNGFPNNMNYNNDPAVDQANKQLIGGQSNVGNGPEIMQGVANAQNNQGIMQGFSDVQNPNGVMQGIVSEPQNINNSAPMPGQFNSGINNYTMQVERSQDDIAQNEQVTPNVEPTIPNNDVNVPSFNNQQPVNINAESIPVNNPVTPQMNINNGNIFDNYETNNQVNEPIDNSLNQNMGNINSIDRPVIDGGIPNGVEINPQVNSQPEMPIYQTENVPINPINTMPQEEQPNFNVNQNMGLNNQNMNIPAVDIPNESTNQSMPGVDVPNMNEENMNNEVQNFNTPGTVNSELNNPNPFAMNNENLQNDLNGQMSNEPSISQTNIVENPIHQMPINDMNIGQNNGINGMTMEEPIISPIMDQPQALDNGNINNQIGNTQDLNSFVGMPEQPGFNNNINQPIPQVNNNNNYQSIDMPQEKVKKFPLSLRETILVTIALIGIVIVVIMYWPK